MHRSWGKKPGFSGFVPLSHQQGVNQGLPCQPGLPEPLECLEWIWDLRGDTACAERCTCDGLLYEPQPKITKIKHFSGRIHTFHVFLGSIQHLKAATGRPMLYLGARRGFIHTTPFTQHPEALSTLFLLLPLSLIITTTPSLLISPRCLPLLPGMISPRAAGTYFSHQPRLAIFAHEMLSPAPAHTEC